MKFKVIFFFIGICCLFGYIKIQPHSKLKEKRVYWLIPDGFRAEPTTMKIYEWAQKGLLPNILWMMKNGSYGYSIPVFPGHTPSNTASLVTGTYPSIHGVSDGGMRTVGYPIAMANKNGYSSVTKKVPPIWYTLEERGKKVALISVPGSTPPEISLGITLRGRWGGWGFDFPAIIFHSKKDKPLRLLQGLDNRNVGTAPELTRFQNSVEVKNWILPLPKSYDREKKGQELIFDNWGTRVFGYAYATQNSANNQFDRILFSFDKKNIICDLGIGEWSQWENIDLFLQPKIDQTNNKNINLEKKYSPLKISSKFKIRIIQLGEKNFFRLRFIYDNLNSSLLKPSNLFSSIESFAGPMIDFVDNYPPQLVYTKEDKKVFLEEAEMSLDWHKKIVDYFLNQTDSQVIIHDIYTPNQMLTSRWWLPYLDPKSNRYNSIDELQREKLWSEVLNMYKKIDDVLGQILKSCHENCYVVLSSDHGVIPLDHEVLVNNILAKEGLLKYVKNPKTLQFDIDWKHTKAVFLQMNHIYISPQGFQSAYERSSGNEFNSIRNRIKNILTNLKSPDGKSIFAKVVNREDASLLNLPFDTVGDLILVNEPGFSPVESVTKDSLFLKDSLKGGYKQGVDPSTTDGMWTPFMISGPDIAKGHKIINPIVHVDQYPTIMRALGEKIPSFVQGHILDEIFIKNN